MEPALKALRWADGKKGSSMALMYDQMWRLDVFYGKAIAGLDERIRKKVIGNLQT